TLVPDRALDDDANILIHYENGARGVLYASQISVGDENNLNIRIYGTEGALEWHQEHPNHLYFRPLNGPEQVFKRGNEYLSASAQANSRLPSGHPEAFFEAFANVYRNAIRTIAAKQAGETPSEHDTDFPTAEDGARGVHFILTAVKSGEQRAWVDASYSPPA
ncbi:MAG TPA: Gfo/Idh/MocA family oxidoreductase, partial [Rhodothermales bacterium]|nr:Gfo/Idh/MocA family oxidoreductase [Rhodothermales bacterium]